VKETNKLKAILSRGVKDITETRAGRVAKSCFNSYQKRVMELEASIDSIDDKIEALEDLSANPEWNQDSKLTSFDGSKWIAELEELHVERELVNIRLLALKQNVGQKYFSADEEA